MLLYQIELRSLDESGDEPEHYIVGRYRSDPGLQLNEEVWINWQVGSHTFEISAEVRRYRKEVYVDGKHVALNMGEAEKAQFSALYPEGIRALLDGASLFLVRIFVEAKDRSVLLKIKNAIAQNDNLIEGQKRLPESS